MNFTCIAFCQYQVCYHYLVNKYLHYCFLRASSVLRVDVLVDFCCKLRITLALKSRPLAIASFAIVNAQCTFLSSASAAAIADVF